LASTTVVCCQQNKEFWGRIVGLSFFGMNHDRESTATKPLLYIGYLVTRPLPRDGPWAMGHEPWDTDADMQCSNIAIIKNRREYRH
jgi:hypothetical protein